jgi:hypothetical protein
MVISHHSIDAFVSLVRDALAARMRASVAPRMPADERERTSFYRSLAVSVKIVKTGISQGFRVIFCTLWHSKATPISFGRSQ